jgi:5'-3' exonuclease
MICLIDLSAIFAQSWHAAGPEAQGAGYEGTLTAINRIANANPRNVAICCDSSTNWRKVLEPTYKANREKAPATYYEQLTRVKQRLVRDGYLLWTSEGYEADDIIATATDAALEAGHEVLIATSDKDLLQLVADKVHVLRTHTWETWDIPKVVEKFGVQPARLGMWLALVGDKADNVPGCPLVGPKVATSLVTDYPSWPALWEAVNTPPGVMPTAAGKQSAVGLNLRTYQTQVELAAKLVALRFDAPIEFKEIFDERAQAARAIDIAEEHDVPHDLGAIQDAIEEKATTVSVEEALAKPQDAHAAAPPPAVTTLAKAAPKELDLPTPGVPFSMALEPRTYNEAKIFAQAMFESHVYAKFPNAQSIWATILRGRNLGLGAVESVDAFHIIDGKPVPMAWLIINLAMRNPLCEYMECISASKDEATWVAKKKGAKNEVRVTWTYQQAVDAGLPKTGPRGPNAWLKTPEDMNVKMAGVRVGRRSGLDLSMLHSFEEIDS